MFFFSCLVSQWLRSNFSEPETVLVLRTKQWVRRCPLLGSRQGGRRHTAATRRQGHWRTVAHEEEQEMRGWREERANFYIYFNLYLRFSNTHFLDYLFCDFIDS